MRRLAKKRVLESVPQQVKMHTGKRADFAQALRLVARANPKMFLRLRRSIDREATR